MADTLSFQIKQNDMKQDNLFLCITYSICYGVFGVEYFVLTAATVVTILLLDIRNK